MIWGTGCTEWGYTDACPSVVVWLPVCCLHGYGARGGLSVDTDGENRIELGMCVRSRVKQGRCGRIIAQWLGWESGGRDVPRGGKDDAHLVQMAK